MDSKKRIYYMVRPEFNNAYITYYHILKNGRRKICTECLCGYEIITEWKFKRITKTNPNYMHIFARISVKLDETYWIFGIHFAEGYRHDPVYIDYMVKTREKLIKELVNVYDMYCKEVKQDFRHFTETTLINYLNVDELEECIRFYSNSSKEDFDGTHLLN